MPLQPRHTVAALATAFLVGTVGGGLLLAGDGDTASGTAIPFNPEADEAEKADDAAAPKPKSAGAFTAEAVKQGNRIVITGEGAEPGAKLVVQRKEGSGWQDFPARATVSSNGSYSTYIITSRDGTYRLKDTGSDSASEPVQIKA